MISQSKETQTVLTVYLGVYNGREYLDGIRAQLQNQDLRDFHLVVVDNDSEDDSWQHLQQWKEVFGERIKLYRNERNLGGGGSLINAINSGWIDTPWFAQIHQDDNYFPNHLSTLDSNIRKSPNDVIAFCTSMASIDQQGKQLPVKARAMWLSQSTSPESSFLLNLRSQALSWPSSAFKTEQFRTCFKYWHSPTFSDTEATLLLCGLGEFRYLQIETMAYRENPTSESHVIQTIEGRLGAAISLARVLSSHHFYGIISRIEPASRRKFYLELMAGISIRLSNSSAGDLVKIIATEACWKSWQGSEQESANWLSTVYKSVDSKFTPKLIEQLAGIPRTSIDKILAERLQKLLDVPATIEPIALKSSTDINCLNQIYLRFPLRIRIMIFKKYSRVRGLINSNYYWKFRWK